jgi:hypothetical protein
MYSSVSTYVSDAWTKINGVPKSSGSSGGANGYTASEAKTRAANNAVYNNIKINTLYNTGSSVAKNTIRSVI